MAFVTFESFARTAFVANEQVGLLFPVAGRESHGPSNSKLYRQAAALPTTFFD
jgi:hypothetical protein